MNENTYVSTDPWQRALGPARVSERRSRRPKPGPGRHRPEVTRSDAWQRALSGPPISNSGRAS